MTRTAEEVAVKLWDNLRKKTSTTEGFAIIAQALAAFAEEMVIEDRKLWDDQHALDLKLHSKQARASALEEAAKIAEDCDHPHDCEGPMIAKAIRALKGGGNLPPSSKDNP